MEDLLRPRHAPSVALLRELVDVAGASNAQIQLVLAEFDLTETMAGVLWLLNDRQTPVPMREMAGPLGCDPSNVTLISDRLESLQLIERRRHPSDGRARVLALTSTGEMLWRTVLETLVSTSILGQLTAREQQQLGGLLGKLLAPR